MFCVCIALAFRVEIVCFSPGQRASMSMLTRMKEFIATLGLENRIIMSNSESLRVQSLQGGTALIRSLPSAVAVCHTFSIQPFIDTTTHTTQR